MLFFRLFPLLIVPALFYAAIALPQSPEALRTALAGEMFAITLPSGAVLVMTLGYAFVIFAAVTLFIEIVKSTRPTNLAIAENGLSFAAFVLALILFLIAPAFGTIEFFLIMVMMMLDFLAGAIVMIFVARRDIAYEH